MRKGMAHSGVVVSDSLPISPSLEQFVVRSVRHGLADVLIGLGEDVGPAPEDHTHAIMCGGKMLVSASLNAALMRNIR
jgi:hypothetical protein